MNANEAAHYKDLWEQACEHVAEACALLGVDVKIYPPDTWTLREFARRAKDRIAALETKLRCAKGEHCWATSGGKTECNDCGVLG